MKTNKAVKGMKELKETLKVTHKAIQGMIVKCYNTMNEVPKESHNVVVPCDVNHDTRNPFVKYFVPLSKSEALHNFNFMNPQFPLNQVSVQQLINAVPDYEFKGDKSLLHYLRQLMLNESTIEGVRDTFISACTLKECPILNTGEKHRGLSPIEQQKRDEILQAKDQEIEKLKAQLAGKK